MSQLIDRRLNTGKKSTVNRQRFIRRYKRQIKEAVSKAIGKRSITNIHTEEQISIPAKDMSEPRFSQGVGGRVERILPGNDQFHTGDKVKRPPQETQGQGAGQGGQQGESDDNFVFELSRDEFLDLYFEDLALPDLIRKELSKMDTPKTVRAGVTSTGIPTNLNIVKSMRQATGRRLALAAPYQRELKTIIEKLKSMEEASGENDEKKRHQLKERQQYLEHKISRIPFLDTLDLRYNNRIKIPAPTTQAVMFCIMDVSGSMDETKKDIAKRFFILLYLFLTKNYQKIELVFIRHHTAAKEVSEEEFFYSRETGGTVVSSALELLDDIIHSRYPANAWNIYAAQASDGDNWNADSPRCQELLRDRIMPLLQYFAYVEIMPRHHQSLWEVYEVLAKQHPHFCMESINSMSDIYPVFRELFKKKKTA